MRNRLRTGGLAAAAAAVLAAGLLSGPAGGADPTVQSPPVLQPAGLLTLSTGAADRVQLLDTDGAVAATQGLAPGRGCSLVRSGADLLSFAGQVNGTARPASFASDSIGVAEKTSGTSCSRVDGPAESLTLTLGAGVRGEVAAAVAASAYLDLELKQSARVVATATSKGVVVGRYELQSGGTRGTPPTITGGPGVQTQVFSCTGSADSGPDSGTGDNCRWPISTPSWLGADDGVQFDALRLAAVSGSFSLEGGGDGLVSVPAPAGFPQGPSLFELVEPVDGVLDCDATTGTEAGDGLTKPTIVVDRLGNADPAEPCTRVPYLLTNSNQSAEFLKPLDRQFSAQFVARMTWTLPAASYPVPGTKVDFTGTSSTADDLPIGWCPKPVVEEGVFSGIENPLTSGLPDFNAATPTLEYACVGTQVSRSLPGAGGTVEVIEQIYILGDILLRK